MQVFCYHVDVAVAQWLTMYLSQAVSLMRCELLQGSLFIAHYQLQAEQLQVAIRRRNLSALEFGFL